eukprot:GFKZ01000021.1.p1 GENE.GFKZ01000021.1~~GFKZ01000021.1.p1  ORF type:complete len:525 (+),score=80.12 GFKZ01000021.1:368-1942(+)
MADYTAPSFDTMRCVPPPSPSPALISFTGPPSDSTLQTLSHHALRHRIASFANLLTTSIPPHSTVALILPNIPEFPIAYLAITATALSAAPLNPAYTADEFSFYLSDAQVHTVIVPTDTPQNAPILTAAQSLALPVIRLPPHLAHPASEFEETPDAPYPTAADYNPGPADVAMFLHTSGTTSRPKGVPLSHANLTSSLANIAQTYELSPSDRCLLVMPLFHVHGLMAATLTTLATGGAVVFPPGGKFSASAFWPALVSARATWYTAVPTIQQILLARADKDYPAEPPKLRFIRSCSASLAPAVLQRLESRFGAPVLEAYAMTEAAHQMTSNPLPKYGERKAGSVGIAQGGVKVAVLDERNEVVGVGVGGEVCIQGDNVTKGYQNNPAANEVAFAGGWFHTGDQGVLDADGYLTLTGRIKELVNRGGEKISPLEVDAALLAHDGVKEAVSFAVPDEKYGEEVNAAVILKEGVAVGAEDLSKFASGKLAAFKVPKRFFICDDLPRTATGKIQRRIVSKHFLDQLAA